MTLEVRKFVYDNITPYEGDASFLAGPTEKTNKLMEEVRKYLKEERDNNGLRSADPSTISTITSHKPGYIKKELETIVGLQTDEPLKRAIKPFGGVRIVEKALNERGIELDPKVKEIFKYAKNHNDAVFSAYDSEIRMYRTKHVLTGLPDNYARGRII
jgi:formate C-acetyltransferase